MKGYFRKRGDKWSFTIDVGKDPVTGKRKQKSRSGFKTKKEAQRVCAELIYELEQGYYREPQKMTVENFMSDFIENQVRPNLRPSTVENYEKTLEKAVAPAFGQLPISELTPLHIQSLYKQCQDKGYKPGTIKVFHSCLKKVLSTAFEWGLIKTNPAVVRNPKIDKGTETVWTVEECYEFLNQTKGSIYYVVYLLAIFTGMRRGEILGLSIENVDFEENKITIDQQLISVGGKVELDKTLKSKSSYRVIDVPQKVMTELKAYLHERKKLLLNKGIRNEHGLVFTTSKGKWIHPNQINHKFRKDQENCRLRKIPFHGLRHSHATMLAELKENVHAISDRLGHSSTTITNEMYIHLTDKMKKGLSDHLNELYEEKFYED